MKKYLLAAALVLISTSALADRTVSGLSGVWVNCPSVSGSFDSSRNCTCESAKKDALGKTKPYEEVIESYSQCECDQGSNGKWSCSVDARLEKKN